jgi:hypothetical protein
MQIEPLMPPAKITKPGFYSMVDTEYHADPCEVPSLSSTIGRKLINASPAHARNDHPRLNPDHEPVNKPKFDFGSLIHKLVLGAGADIAVFPYDAWRTKDARVDRDAAYEDGKIPVLQKDFDRANAMQSACYNGIVETDKLIRDCMKYGASEVVAVWQEQSIWCRAMLDKVLVSQDGETATIIDYKSTEASAAHHETERRIFQMGYDFQGVFYGRGLVALLPEIKELRFAIITQEVTPPFGMSVLSPTIEAAELAEVQVLTSLALWERCMSTDEWPGYPLTTLPAKPLPWTERDWLAREVNDPMLAGLDISRFYGERPEREPEKLTVMP